MKKRVCLISPGHVSFNPRLVKEADALAEAGYDVHVVAANDLPNLRALDAPILANAKWSFQLVGGVAALDKVQRGAARLARRAIDSGVSTLALAELGHHALVWPLRRAASKWKADLYIAHYIAALPAACHAARKHGAAWAFDAEDFHRGQFEDDEADSPESRIVRRLEAAYLPRAAYLTAASPGIADAYAGVAQVERPIVILNVFPRSNGPLAPSERGGAEPGPSLYWFSQTIGAKRGIECAIEAISIARSRPHLYLRGNMQAGFDRTMRALAEKAGVADRVHVLPPEIGADMERLASRHDLGLVAETGSSINRAIALTNKLFTYLLAGVPALVSDIPAHREIASACESLILFQTENAVDLAAAIDRVLLNPEDLARLRGLAWEAGQRTFNWDVEKAKLIELVERRIGSP